MIDSGEPREGPSPSAYRKENPYRPPPPDYKPPSVLAEHKGLAILFAALSIGFAVYCLRHPHPHPHAAPASNAARPAQPIYIEAMPDKDSR